MGSSPKAARLALPRWLDAKLVLGVLLVLVSVVLGVRVFAAADSSVGVWRLRASLPAGATLNAARDLEVAKVHFASTAVADSYVAAADPVPVSAQLLRPVTAGELLPRTAFSTAPPRDLVDLPVAVVAGNYPAGLTSRGLVDVYVVPAERSGGPAPAGAVAARVLSGVPIVHPPTVGAGFSGGNSELTVRVDAGKVDVGRVAAQLAGGTAYVVGRPAR